MLAYSVHPSAPPQALLSHGFHTSLHLSCLFSSYGSQDASHLFMGTLAPGPKAAWWALDTLFPVVLMYFIHSPHS